jgi:hypothetical protein
MVMERKGDPVLIDILVIAIIAAGLVAIALYYIRNKKSGKSSACGYGCNGCPSVMNCPGKIKPSEND